VPACALVAAASSIGPASGLRSVSLESLVTRNLTALALEYREQYAAAKPFPHIVLDGIMDEAFLRQVSQEVPERGVRLNGCFPWASRCSPLGTLQLNAESEDQVSWEDGLDVFLDPRHERGKNGNQNIERMGANVRRADALLQSKTWTDFLSMLTGIRDLHADPFHNGAGIHATSQGGFLHVHADFNRHPSTKERRRVNMFFFLNEDWREEYGGHLELWDRGVTRCEQRILPIFNRLVIFSSTDFSYHGHPHPLMAPPNRSRRSLAQYYYTTEHPAQDCMNLDCHKQHSTLWQVPHCDCPVAMNRTACQVDL